MEVKSEQEVLDVLAKFPLIKFMKPEIHELAFHDNVHSGFPHLSLN
jgi:muconolactone delta-isomerase